MNAELLQDFYSGLETLMRERRQLLARRVLAVEPNTSVATVPLTPALSIGEGENRSPVDLQSDALQHSSVLLTELPAQSPALPVELRKSGDKASCVRIVENRTLLFPLSQGEGQGEGKALAQLKSLPA